MSSATVRAAFRSQLADLLAPDFAYVESINVASLAGDLPDRWYTLDFQAGSDERIALGRPTLFRESGTASVLIFTQQQITDAPATQAAETLRDAMANWFDASGMLRVTEANPPADLDGGDFRGAWYGVSVDLRYQFDRFVE